MAARSFERQYGMVECIQKVKKILHQISLLQSCYASDICSVKLTCCPNELPVSFSFSILFHFCFVLRAAHIDSQMCSLITQASLHAVVSCCHDRTCSHTCVYNSATAFVFVDILQRDLRCGTQSNILRACCVHACFCSCNIVGASALWSVHSSASCCAAVNK